MAKIYAPNKQYTGLSASVMFVNGVGETSDPHLIKWFRERGYKVVEEEESKQGDDQGEQSPEDDQGEQPPVKGGRKNGKVRKIKAGTGDSGK